MDSVLFLVDLELIVLSSEAGGSMDPSERSEIVDRNYFNRSVLLYPDQNPSLSSNLLRKVRCAIHWTL